MRHTVATTRTYPEGDYWRWYVRDVNGKEYVDGGNYLTQDAADKGNLAGLWVVVLRYSLSSA